MCSPCGVPTLFRSTLKAGAYLGGFDALPGIKGLKPPAEFVVEGSQCHITGVVMLLEQTQRFAHDFAGRIVAAGFHFRTDIVVKLGRKRTFMSGAPDANLAGDVELCQ